MLVDNVDAVVTVTPFVKVTVPAVLMFNALIVLAAALTTFPVPIMFATRPAGLPPPAVNVSVPYTFTV